jgi:high-affinity iron transporter
MLPTFVIGLREGLEAALIVGIIAAFVRRQGRNDVLRSMWAGVGAAVALCVAVGVLLEAVSRNLPQREQEGLETVIGFLAVGMVTYMVIWMKRHSRDLKGQLEGLASDALGARGAGRAMVAMAFLAVLREGFETVVFLLAAFNESGSGTAAGVGAVLGIAVAVALGYGIYRGGVHLNLSRFFRATGLVLVVVAAGLVLNGFHTAHEAGWVNFGQARTVDLSWLVRPGSVQSSLLTGMLGIQPRPVVVEVVAWLAYLLPVGIFVAWPPGRPVPRRRLRLAAAGTAVAAGTAALVLALVAPAHPQVDRRTPGAAGPVELLEANGHSAVVRTAVQSPAAAADRVGAVEAITLEAAGRVQRAGLSLERYTATLPGRGASGRPAELPLSELATLNGGRLPLGIRAQTAAPSATVPVTYRSSTVLTIWVEPQTGRLVDLRWVESVRAAVTSPTVGTIPLDGTVARAAAGLPAGVAAHAATAARDDVAQLEHRADLHDAAWATGVVALLALLAAAALSVRRPPARRPQPVASESTASALPS